MPINSIIAVRIDGIITQTKRKQLEATATTFHFRFSVNLTEACKIACFYQTAKAIVNGFQEIRTFARKSSEITELWVVLKSPCRRFADQHS